MTEQQLATLDYLTHQARETGALVKCDEYSMTDDGTLLVTETGARECAGHESLSGPIGISVQCDGRCAEREFTAWNLYRDGALEIL